MGDGDVGDIVMLMTICGCWWLNFGVGDILVPDAYDRRSWIKSPKLSPIHFVSSIRHKQCNRKMPFLNLNSSNEIDFEPFLTVVIDLINSRSVSSVTALGASFIGIVTKPAIELRQEIIFGDVIKYWHTEGAFWRKLYKTITNIKTKKCLLT